MVTFLKDFTFTRQVYEVFGCYDENRCEILNRKSSILLMVIRRVFIERERY